MASTAEQTQAETKDEKPQDPPQGNTMYEWIGGEPALRALVDRFYDLMDSDPEVATIRAMHKADLSPMRQSLFEWLSGWLGGPPLFIQKRGSPCINAAHRPFRIDEAARDQWLRCMAQAIEDTGIEPRFGEMLMPAFRRVADALVNTRDEATDGSQSDAA